MTQHLTRMASAALLAAGAVTLTATPALAAEVDFGVDVRSTTAAGVTIITVAVTNNGTTTPDDLTLAIDTSAIDKSRVSIFVPNDCPKSGVGFECVYTGKFSVPAPGESLDLKAVFWRPADVAPGDVGDLAATVSVEADAVETNNSKSIPVVTSPVRSPALRVSQETVSQVEGITSATGKRAKGLVEKFDRAEAYTGKPIPPGGKSTTLAEVVNYGAVAAVGLRTVGKLPDGVRFVTDGLDNCDFSADRRTATCIWDEHDAHLSPWIFDPGLDKYDSSYAVRMLVVVDKDAKGPADLAGGEWTVTPVATAEPDLSDSGEGQDNRGAAVGNARLVDNGSTEAREHVEFAVRVGASATGGGSGNGAGNGAGSDDPSLPITGPVASALIGAGSVLVAIGAFLMLATRRRRGV